MHAVLSRLTRLVLPVATFALLAGPVAAQIQQSADPVAKTISDPISHEGYIEPTGIIKKLVDIPRTSNITFTAGSANPVSRKYLLRPLRENMTPLAVMGKYHYNLAGWQIEPRANRARSLTNSSSYGYEFHEWETGRVIPLQVPAGARVNGPSWSPDGKTFAFLAQFDTATHIYFADPATGRARPLTTRSLLATNVTSYYWTPDGASIVAVLTPANRPPEPKEPAVAPEPIVRVNERGSLRTRTFFDLLQTPYEMSLMEYHMNGQLGIIDVKTRAIKHVGNPGLVRTLNGSPDGKYFEVTYLERPYSYYQQVGSFPTRRLLIDQTGKVLRTLALPRGVQPDTARDPNDPDTVGVVGAPAGGRRGGAPTGGAQQGRGAQGQQGRGAQAQQGRGNTAQAPAPPAPSRNLGRRSETWNRYGSGHIFLQLEQPAANQRNDSAVVNRLADRIVVQENPADSASVKVLYTSPAGNNIQSFSYSDDGKILFLTETGRTQPGEVAIFLAENNARYVIAAPAAGRGGGGAAAAPAAGGRGGGGGGRGAGGGGGGGGGTGVSFVSKTGSRGFPVVMISSDGKSVFNQGAAQNRPFVEKIEIKTGTRTRIYESSVTDMAESIVAPLDDDFNKALVNRNGRNEVTQQYILDLRTKEAKKITNNVVLQPEMQGLIEKTIYARRPDNGANIRIVVTLPQTWRPGQRLPAMFWFYPREFQTVEAYQQQAGGGGRAAAPADTAAAGRGGRGAGGGGGGGGGQNFAQPRTFGSRDMKYLTQLGYAVIAPDAPIFATETSPLPNNNYVRDLQAALHAVVNALSDSGFIDRHRIGIGGHSYGGFSTVNAMVHTNLFKAGIAGDGNYNRTLTPNGFQSERRVLWEAQDVYLAMSPFLHLDKLTGALLIYHSTEDQNVGTDPINAPKLFHALQGLGKTAALYMYPYEDHGPVARETVLDQWARWVAWLDKYVKNAPSPYATNTSAPGTR